MRKFLISFAVAGAALAAASPAAAQYYPQAQRYGGYGTPQYAYNGYGQNGYGQLRALQARIDNVQRQIRQLDRGHGGWGYGNRGGNVDRLRGEARDLENRLRRTSRHGLNPYEANDIERRVARLEQRVNYAMAGSYGRNRYGFGNSAYGNGYGYSNRGDDDHDRGDGRDHDRDDDHDD